MSPIFLYLRLIRLKRILPAVMAAIAASGLALTGVSHAAGLEYSKQSVAPLFMPGNYLELSYGYVDPKIIGIDRDGNDIDDMMDHFDLPGAALKIAPTPSTALAVIYETPWGVDTAYPTGNIFNNAMGATEARVSTEGITTLAGGKVGGNIWLYGGLEYQTIEGFVTGAQPVGLTTALAETGQSQAQYEQLLQQATETGQTPFILDLIEQVASAPTYYTLDFENEDTLAPVLGVAYEKPEIALRAALTYRAPAKYQISGRENLQVILPDNPLTGGDGVTPTPAAEGLPYQGSTEVKFPQSVNIDFQTGLSEKHQLLGMINARWVDWSDFSVMPPVALEATQEPLAAYSKDGYSVEVALGKQFSPKLGGEVRVGYDHGTGLPLSVLGPYGAMTSLALGGEYQITEHLSVAAGGQYMWFDGGDIDTKVDGVVAAIENGDGYAVGMKVGYHF